MPFVKLRFGWQAGQFRRTIGRETLVVTKQPLEVNKRQLAYLLEHDPGPVVECDAEGKPIKQVADKEEPQLVTADAEG